MKNSSVYLLFDLTLYISVNHVLKANCKYKNLTIHSIRDFIRQ